MDAFNVPKKINRHVLKAINILSNGKSKKPVSASAILNQVKYQVRNLVPVPNIDRAVQKSLENLSAIGLIERAGLKKYALGRWYATLPQDSTLSSPGDPKFRADSRKRSRSELNPNFNRAYQSEESLSGDEFDRTRKRLRTNKDIKYSGRSAELPKARQHRRHHVANDYALDNPLFPPGDFGANYFSDHSLNQNLFTCDYVNMEFTLNNDPASLQITEIKNDNSDSFYLQRENKIPKKSDIPMIQLYPKINSSNSITTLRDNIDPSIETSVTTKKSNLVEDSNLCITTRRDITADNSVESSSGSVNSPCVASEKSNLVVDSKVN